MSAWVAGAIVVGSVVGAVASDRAAGKGEDAANASTAEGRRQFDLTREDFAEGRRVGDAALGRLDRIQSGDFSDFFTSPGFEFVRDEGLRGIENRFSASGGALSGNALRRLTEFNSGLASQEFGSFVNRDLAIAGRGGAATAAGAAAGTAISGNIQNSLLQAGNARASGVMGINDAFQSGISNFFTARQAGLFTPKPTAQP